MNIYFHIDELNRDAIVASALRNKFANKGHTLVYGNRVSNRLLNYFPNCFDIIIMPRPHIVYDNWGESWLKWNAKFVMLSTESLGIICKDHHVMARTLLEREYFEGKKKYVNRIDAFCVWGAKQLQSIRDFAPEVAPKCHVVGHPRHDQQCRISSVPNSSHMRTAKKRIGIITRAVGLNDYFGRCALDAFSTLLDEHFQFEYHNKETGEKLISSRTSAQPAENLTVQSIDAATTIKIAKLLSQDGHDVFIRPHPKENPIVWEKLMQQSNVSSHIADPKLPIATWLSSLDYVVGPPSTSFYDAVMLGVTPISISELDVRRSQFVGQLWEDNNRLMPHIYKPKSLNGLKEYINSDQRLILSPEISQILREEADYPECISSLDKVVKICESLVSYKNNRACSRLQLFLFSHARLLFTMIWKIKNLISSRKENSALFAMDHKNIEFINKLSIQKITYKS